MSTIERSIAEIPTQDAAPQRNSTGVVVVAIVGLLALVLGGFAGWMIRGDDSGDVPAIVVAGGEEPTSRQEQMVDFHRDYIEAWKVGDVAAIRSMYVPEGTITLNDVTYDVASPEFVDFVGLGTVSKLLEPHLVAGNTMFNFIEVVGASTENTLRFTRSGELLLTDHVIVNSSVR
jgi:hypothetical protein